MGGVRHPAFDIGEALGDQGCCYLFAFAGVRRNLANCRSRRPSSCRISTPCGEIDLWGFAITHFPLARKAL